MIISEEVAKLQKSNTLNLFAEYQYNFHRFRKFNFRRNNCSNTVKEFLSLLGVDTTSLTPWADTIRSMGSVYKSPWELQVGDIVAMGRPGDTHHVGVYMGGDKVLHQSGSRGYIVGVYADLRAFITHRAGFYFVRPDYSHLQTPASPPTEEFIASPEPLTAPEIGG